MCDAADIYIAIPFIIIGGCCLALLIRLDIV